MRSWNSIPANVNNISCFHMLDWTITNPDKIGRSVWLTFCSALWWCTLHLPLPAGWEGWGLHQPPRVQNRPRHRVQAEIVSLHHMSPELLIKHICSLSHTTWAHAHTRAHHAYTKPANQSPCLTAVPSKHVIPKSRASSSPPIVSRKWTGEPGYKQSSETVDVTCLCMTVFAVKTKFTRGNRPPRQHHAWIRHDPGPLLINEGLVMCVCEWVWVMCVPVWEGDCSGICRSAIWWALIIHTSPQRHVEIIGGVVINQPCLTAVLCLLVHVWKVRPHAFTHVWCVKKGGDGGVKEGCCFRVIATFWKGLQWEQSESGPPGVKHTRDVSESLTCLLPSEVIIMEMSWGIRTPAGHILLHFNITFQNAKVNIYIYILSQSGGRINLKTFKELCFIFYHPFIWIESTFVIKY